MEMPSEKKIKKNIKIYISSRYFNINFFDLINIIYFK
jgi:hypothetical protein